MKKRTIFLCSSCLLLVTILFLGITNCSNITIQNQTDDTMITKAEYTLDTEYKEAIKTCNSNIEKTNTNLKFAQKWDNLCEHYYQCILQSKLLNNESKNNETITTTYNDWKASAQEYINTEEKRLLSIYKSGSIVPLKLSQYEYILYRSHAIKLYNICVQSHLDCTQP